MPKSETIARLGRTPQATRESKEWHQGQLRFGLAYNESVYY